MLVLILKMGFICNHMWVLSFWSTYCGTPIQCSSVQDSTAFNVQFQLPKVCDFSVKFPVFKILYTSVFKSAYPQRNVKWGFHCIMYIIQFQNPRPWFFKLQFVGQGLFTFMQPALGLDQIILLWCIKHNFLLTQSGY